MKKFLKTISLLLAVVLLVLAMPLSVSAAEGSYGAAADFAINNSSLGLNVYDGTGIYLPSDKGIEDFIDGVVTADDPWYNNAITVSGEEAMIGGFYTNTGLTDDEIRAIVAASESKYYFAHDEDYIYIATATKMGTLPDGTALKNFISDMTYSIGFGFNANDYTAEYHIPLGTHVAITSVEGYSDLTETFNDSFDARYQLKYVFERVMATRYLQSGELFDYESVNVTEPYILYHEMAINKELLKEQLNLDSLDIMFFRFMVNVLKDKDNKDLAWNIHLNGTEINAEIADKALENNITMYSYKPDTKTSPRPYSDLVVFGELPEKPVETQPVVTEPVATEPAATEPAATEPAVTEPVATEPAATESATEGGCGGSVSFAGLAIIAMLGTCTAFVTKRK